MGRLTTHVLDTANGRPGADMAIDLYRVEGESRIHLTSLRSNEDGRCDGPVIEGDAMAAGIYEFVFHAGDYFAATGVDLPDPPFVNEVVVRFGIADPNAHYHVPLLVSPWSYSTYRGS